MTTTGTTTRTFTVVDIRRVVDCFASDYDMIAQATGLVPQEHVTNVVHDIKTLAEAAYIARVHLILLGSEGESLRAAVYEVKADGSASTTQRPGGNLWPRTPKGSLRVVVEHTAAWQSLDESSKGAVRAKLSLPWSASDLDTTYPGLAQGASRTYASNGYAWTKNDYQ